MPERSADPDKPGRVLGLDHGDARIGVAITDDARRLAVPFGTVHTGAPADLKAIASIVQEQGVVEIVVGHPLSLDGTAGVRADHAERFADALSGFLADTPVHLFDERLSTVEASRALDAAGTRGRKQKGAIDRSAATVILQAFIDTRPGA